MGLERGKRCESGFLRSGGLSARCSTSSEGQSVNYSLCEGVEVFLCNTLSVFKLTFASPINGGDGEVWRRIVETPLGKFENQGFLILQLAAGLYHRIG